MSYSRQVQVLDSASANSSTRTSATVLVADWNQISVSVHTSNALGSLYTVWGTNQNISTTSLVEGDWSAITGLSARGLYTVASGMQALRVTRSALDSQGTVIFSGAVIR